MPYQPTRLPYGISYGYPNANTSFAQAKQYTLPSNVTPNVDYGTLWIAASGMTITNFTSAVGDEYGRLIYIKATTNGVILQNSLGGITFNNLVGTGSGTTVSFTSGGNITMLDEEVLEFINDGTSWCLVGNRFVLFGQV